MFAENGVSDLVGEQSKYAEITVSTEASVASTVANVTVTKVKSSQIDLSWEVISPMSNEATEEIENYEVNISQKKNLCKMFTLN